MTEPTVRARAVVSCLFFLFGLLEAARFCVFKKPIHHPSACMHAHHAQPFACFPPVATVVSVRAGRCVADADAHGRLISMLAQCWPFTLQAPLSAPGVRLAPWPLGGGAQRKGRWGDRGRTPLH